MVTWHSRCAVTSRHCSLAVCATVSRRTVRIRGIRLEGNLKEILGVGGNRSETKAISTRHQLFHRLSATIAEHYESYLWSTAHLHVDGTVGGPYKVSSVAIAASWKEDYEKFSLLDSRPAFKFQPNGGALGFSTLSTQRSTNAVFNECEKQSRLEADILRVWFREKLGSSSILAWAFLPLLSLLDEAKGNEFFLESLRSRSRENVLNELEGLARGADARDCPPASRATLDPEHVARVAESAKAALAFARSRNPAIRCLTTRGTVLTSSTFTVEEDVDKDKLTRNDDRILATCLSLCRTGNKDHNNPGLQNLIYLASAEEGQPRRLRREVVLLTEDRNLRVKALARDVPVREVPDFMEWAGLG
uniref:PIN domain-containing protein n=1 Tax=Vespula pensylvanica TaxID=30213 RepID=A0A834PGC8_VESPE|nr:hypothetical protein H0235_001077 [Vespula pensylvanica]